MSLLWKTATEDPYEAHWQRIVEEHTHKNPEYVTATDECKHCGRPVLFDPSSEIYHAKSRNAVSSDGDDCEVNGPSAHEVD